MMIKFTLRTITTLIIASFLKVSLLAQVSDKPVTFCNPLSLNYNSERAGRAGEPVVVLHDDVYYLFIQGARGY